MSQRDAGRLLGVDAATAAKIAPLLEDAAAALADAHVPSEAEIHDLVAGTYKFAQSSSLESEDTDRRLEEAMKNLSTWRAGTSVYLNGAAVLLKKLSPGLSRYEAKKRVLAAFRKLHPGPAPERFYFTREAGIELPQDVAPAGPLASVPDPFAGKIQDLTEPQRDQLVRLLALPTDPTSSDARRIVDRVAALGEKAGPSLLRAMAAPDEAVKLAGGDKQELVIGIRSVLPRLPEPWCERVLRAALEAGWLEWLDRPLLDPPLPAPLREKLQKEHGTRQEPGGQPYRPTEAWFYNLDG